MKTCIILCNFVSAITGNILITTIIFVYYYLLLDSSSTFMTDSQYLGTIQIWQNLKEHHYHLTTTESVIYQIDTNCPLFQSLNMHLFHKKLERLKLIYYGLILNFSKYYFKTGTIYLLFVSSHVFTTLEFDRNHFGI